MTATIPRFSHCEFGHLMVPVTNRALGMAVTYWTHVHEGDAIECHRWEQLGWPEPALIEVAP